MNGQPAPATDTPRSKLRLLVGSGDRIGLFVLPFLLGGVALNVAFPSFFDAGGPPPSVRVVSIVALSLADVFSGAVVTETVFAWPGIGRLFVQAMFARDYPLLMGILLMGSLMVIVVNLLPDIAITPRFRASEARGPVARQVTLFNDALRRQARTHGAEVVDLYTASQKEVPARPELLSRDGYHPSDAGYARWAELMWEGIRTRIPR